MNNLLPVFAQSATETSDAEIIAYLMTGLIILVVMFLFFVIPWIFIFKKAGKAGWLAIIPVVNFFIIAKIIGRHPWIILAFTAFSAILSFVPIVGQVVWLVSLFVSALIAYELAIVFNQSQGLAIANIFFSPFINFYLAFSNSAQYQGPLFGADKRIMLESPWLDPELGVQGVNPYATHAYAPDGGFNPNAVGTYQPPAYTPNAAPGTPGAPAAPTPPDGPIMPSQAAAPTAVPGTVPGQGTPADGPSPWTPGAASSVPPTTPGVKPVATAASDWGPAPEALDHPYTPGESTSESTSEAPGDQGDQPANPFGA